MTSILVAAYGPAKTTRAAVRRARALTGGEVAVFAALPTGRQSLVGADVPVIPELGTAGLQAALDALPDGPVLFVHDDVLVTARTLRAMEACLKERGGYVFAYSNDIGMDHFCGPLPEARRAEPAVAARARQLAGPAPDARVVRPSCVLASRAGLIELAGSRIVDPRMRLDVVDLAVWVAPGAVVAHDSSCTRRFVDPPDDRPLVTAVMIVRDEESMLPDCLESLRGFCDRVIVCDTGSVDRTVRIAEAHGAQVIHRQWRNDFGWARSEVVEAAADSVWVFTVDADDRVLLEDPAYLRRMLATYAEEYEALSMTVENRSAVDAPLVSAFDSPRLFRGGRFKYVGAVHEVLMTKDDRRPFAPRMEGVRMVHLGYQQEVMADRAKGERNLRLSREQYERHASTKHAIEYARSIVLNGGDPRGAYELLETVLADLPRHEVRVVSYVLTLMAQQMVALGEHATAMEHAREALELVPADDQAARVFASAAFGLSRPDEIVAMEDRRASAASVRPMFRNERARAAIRSMLCAAQAMCGDVDSASATAREVLAAWPDVFGAWDPLVAAYGAVPADHAVEELSDLALRDPKGDIFGPLPRRVAPAVTAQVCQRYLASGGQNQEAVRLGLVAGLVASLPDVVSAVMPYAPRLDAEIRQAIAERAEARGFAEVASALREAAS